MIVRFDSVSAAPRAKRAQERRAIRATVAAASFLFCGVAAAQGGASAAPGAVSAASSAAAAAVSVAGQYTVHPGQSLHDVAVDVTQSHDKATLARMSQALFDANPNAFIKQDPSRMRVGATLNVPATPDVSSAAAGMTATSGGAAVASAGASAAASASAAAATVATASAASASTPAAASSAAAEAVAAASSAAAAATVGASSASAAAATEAPASAVGASGPTAAAQGASGAAAGASAAEPASAASDSHVWSGSIQPAPASSAAGAAAQGAKVSSLQQLLALKNRVLMALQQHGIGKPAQTAGGASAGAPAAQGGAPVPNGVVNAGTAGGQPEVSPIAIGAVAAVVVALLALFVRLLMRKRKKPVDQAPEVSPEAHEPTPSTSSAAVAAVPAEAEPPVLREPITRAGHEPDADSIAPAAQAEFVPPVAPAVEEVAIKPVPTPEVSSAPLERGETATDAASAAGVDTTAGHDAEALPPTLTEKLHPATPQAPSVAHEARAAQDLPHSVEPGDPQTLTDATEAASLAAAAELGADALPRESIGAPRTAEDAEALARTLEEPARVEKPATPDIALDFGDGASQAAQTQQAPQAEPPIVQTPAVTEAFERPPAPLTAPEIPSVPAVTAEDMSYAEVPIAFPHDAIEALGGLDLPLPPRIGEPVIPPEPLSTEPAATPEASARLSSPFFEPPLPMAGAAIEAGTAGAGALAGLGAPRFGALTLDFDLNLPPDSAEPLPVFTPEQLARIARNKLDLAHEYIALGDVSGARSLINEVIESNDPATRSDAQALLSTLAPLS